MHISTKCSAAIHCLIFIHEYGQTHKVTSTLLSRSTGVNAVTIRNFLSAMKKDGILTVKPGTGGALLAVPLSEINLYRICKVIEPDFMEKLIGYHPNPSKDCPLGKSIYQVLDKPYSKIKDDLQKSLERTTLQDFLTEYRRLRDNISTTPNKPTELQA